MSSDQKDGCIFNIQQFSVHDGPGIRTIVFLKGCPLRCLWCSNPESQQFYPELVFNSNKCIGESECGRCLSPCSHGVMQSPLRGDLPLKRDLTCDCRVDNCPAAALSVFGKSKSVNEVLDIVEADSAFYARSGGGLTISGGEPLGQPQYTLNLLREAKYRRIDRAIETSGYVEWSILEQASEYLNSIIYDIKCLDDHKHIQGTGVSNKLILENFEKLCVRFPNLPILVRTPIIPGFNDSVEDITAIADFIKDKANVQYELLPYHRLGQAKYLALGREYPLGEVLLDDKKMQALQEIVITQYPGLKK